jgi:hypothetical protein
MQARALTYETAAALTQGQCCTAWPAVNLASSSAHGLASLTYIGWRVVDRHLLSLGDIPGLSLLLEPGAGFMWVLRVHWCLIVMGLDGNLAVVCQSVQPYRFSGLMHEFVAAYVEWHGRTDTHLNLLGPCICKWTIVI